MRKSDPELHERRRAQILTAAERCFLEKGFHQASMQDIAGAAELSLGLLYRYFENKEAIIAAFMDIDRDETVALLDEFARSERPLEVLPALLRRVLRQATDPDYVRIGAEVVSEALRKPKLLDVLAQGDAVVRKALIDALKAQQRAGRISAKADPSATSDLIMSAIDGIGTRSLFVDRYKPRSVEKLLIDLIVGLLTP